MQVVKEAILHRPLTQKILFDGIPRDIDQMIEFVNIMNAAGRSFQCVQLTLDDQTAFARIQGRALEQGRADDADEGTIRKRMQIFKERTTPVIDAFRRDGNMIDVDGARPVDEVYEELKSMVQ